MLNNRRKRNFLEKLADNLDTFVENGDGKKWYEDEGFIALMITLIIIFLMFGFIMYSNQYWMVTQFVPEDKDDLLYYEDLLNN